MKKLALLLLIAVVVGGTAFTLDLLEYPPPVEGGNILVDLGVGFGTFGASGWKVKIPPLAATVEYCLPVPVPISVGGMFSFFQYGWDYTGGHSWLYNFMVFAGRANWHWNFDVDWLDFYTGLSMGYQSFSAVYSGPDKTWADSTYNWSYSGLYWAGQVGAHFYFTKHLGAVAEFGYPLLVKAGVALKL